MPFSNATTENIDYFAQITGMPRIVVHAILLCEEQEVDNPTNPLNIEYYGSARPAQIGHEGNFAKYHSNLDGLRDAYGVLQLPYYNELRQVWHTNDPMRIARAWELSPWAAGHYGAGPQTEGCVEKHTKELMATPEYKDYEIHVFKSYKKPFRKFTTIANSTLYGYDPKRPGAPVAVNHWNKESIAHYDEIVGITWPGRLHPPVPHGSQFLHVVDGVYKGLYIVKSKVQV